MKEVWINIQRALNALGESLETDGIPGPKTKAAMARQGLIFNIKKNESPAKSPGISDPRTDKDWPSLVRAGVELHPVFKVPSPYTHLHPIDVLRSVAGEKEIPGSKDNILIAHFHEHAGNLGSHSDSKNDYSDEVPHCASAQNWAQDCSRCEKSNNALASSYEGYASKYGSRSYKPGDIIPEGAIICLDGHVTRANKQFVWTRDGSFEGFGSNQGNTIKTSIYSKSRIKTICDDKPKAGTILAPIGILGMKPTPATGSEGESTR